MDILHMEYMKKLSAVKKSEKIQYFNVTNPDIKVSYMRTKKGGKE